MTTARVMVPENWSNDESSGGRLLATDGRVLPLTEARLRAEARGGVARVVLEQRFENPYADPLTVTYLLPLPADAAVSGFAFTIGDRRVVGEVDRREAARERYQQALVEGRSASLLEQDRSSLFTQEVGNIPPHTAVVAEVTLDQRLAWLPEGSWEWRFPTTVAPRYQGAPGRVDDAAKLQVPIASGRTGARLFLSLTVRDELFSERSPESPSHALRFSREAGVLAASLSSEEGAPLDRDVVVRWPVATPAVGVSLTPCRPEAGREHAASAYALLTLVPPRPEARPRSVPRDLVVLLDTSGSMGGEPLAQARRVVGALIDGLEEHDRLELIEFSTSARRWNGKPVDATPKNRKKALAWLAGLQASGGTEMREGIFEALRPLRADAQRQVVLVTDGLIGFESEVVAAILAKLPPGSRLHTVGVGSSVNRSLTGPAARAGNGVEVVIGLGEDPERAARRLCARTALPVVTEVAVEGPALLECAPARLPDLFAGSPSLVALRLRPEGGALMVSGRTSQGTWRQRVEVRPVDFGVGGGAPATLFARERVEDLETRIASGAPRGELDREIERLGLSFQIATRRTSWVAVSAVQTVDPRQPTRHEEMPHELPFGMSAEGLGLRAGAAPLAVSASTTGFFPRQAAGAAPTGAPPAPCAPAPARRSLEAHGATVDSKAKAKEPGLLDRARRLFKKEQAKADAPVAGEFEFGEAEETSMEPEASAPSPASQVEDQLERAAPKGRVASNLPVARDEGEFFDDEADESSTLAADRAPAKSVAAAPPVTSGALALAGRVLLAKGLELVLEVTIDARGLSWAPSGVVHLVFDDGSVLAAELDLARTTAPVSLVAGQVARLVLRLPAEPTGRARRATLTCHGVALVVELG